jgi:hypothetical protein
MNTYIKKEQQEAWDKVVGPGLYNVYGDGGYQYLCNRIKHVVLNTGDPHTVLLIGTEEERARFLKVMIEEGAIDGPTDIEPWFFAFQDYEDAKDEGGYNPRSTASEVDTEKFCDFIRHATTNSYFPVGAAVILNEDYGGEKSQKYLDRLLKIPVWRGSTKEKDIELPVYNVSNADWSEFSKVNNTTPSGLKQVIEVTFGHEMKPEKVEWLVPDFVPLHQSTAFSGEMDTRKSTLALDIAASGSLMRPWFMGTENDRKPFITLVAADEDTYSTTVLPRFIAAGGYTRHLGCLELNVHCSKQGADGLIEYSTPLSFDAHLNLLGEKITKINNSSDGVKVGLLINDPIISFFGNKSSNNGQETRDIMRGLKKLCEELKITIINICHFNKTQGLTAKQKTSGAKALIEAHRMAWAFDLMEDDPATTLIAPIKHNLMKAAKSYKITTEDTFIKWPVGNRQHQTDHVGRIKFVGYTNKTADERIEEKEDKGRGQRKELKKTILDALKDGPKSPGQVCNDLQGMGCSVRTIQRAAEQLEEEGKLKKSGANRKNTVWQLATEIEQPTFDEVR